MFWKSAPPQAGNLQRTTLRKIFQHVYDNSDFTARTTANVFTVYFLCVCSLVYIRMYVCFFFHHELWIKMNIERVYSVSANLHARRRLHAFTDDVINEALCQSACHSSTITGFNWWSTLSNLLPWCTAKNIPISTDILWRVFRILTEPVPYTFASVNRGNTKRGPTLQYGKLATTYQWIYGYFLNSVDSFCTAPKWRNAPDLNRDCWTTLPAR